MNFSFYILGTPEGQYSQYPDDYTASTLAGLQEGMTGARLVIYREMDLVHYVYTERLGGNNGIIGFCMIFNKARIQKPRQLIRLFRFIIEKRLIESGEVIRYSEGGELKFRVKAMSECVREYDRLKALLNSEFENNAAKYDIVPLTTTYNGIKSIGELGNDASDSQIVSLANLHNKVIVNEDKGIEQGYIPYVIASLQGQNQKALEQIAKLREEKSELEKKKKQYGYVIMLALLVLCCSIWIFFMNGSLNDTQNELSHAKTEISELTSKLSAITNVLNSTKASLKSAKEERDEANRTLADLKKKIGSTMPIVITNIEIANTYYDGKIETDYGNTIYSSSTRYLKPRITYTGIKTGDNITLSVKFYTPSGLSTGSSSPYGYSYSCSMNVYSGENTEYLSGWGGSSSGHWSSGSYRFEIWYNNICLKSKSFTVY